ncbi:hypothetical protein LEP1GSC050_1380 [Leptospira broomii serovar Hurstbridge str. 5399]|uniref:Uncharacterized protein n=1 Tax=Leptospira broomii serovar Hurstbridge str. 5399 TaxID=1049789 RepID=T0GCS3_9LEPT|nr:hypothetical protein LEP1GSC050_1380 [Leptospira broomii serovar Hurstbridge str. 5399]
MFFLNTDRMQKDFSFSLRKSSDLCHPSLSKIEWIETGKRTVTIRLTKNETISK